MLMRKRKDETMEMKHRRNKGQFYTPTLFVDYAHKMIEDQLGSDWKDQYVVWDNCCGTKNLTRDYRFKELYCSTLEEAELEIGKKYNPEAISFQYDFLNDDLEKLPNGLKDVLLENKPIVFLLNPPYARNGGIGNNGQVCFTKIREDMNNNKIGACSANLYAQFLWRIKNIKEKYNLTNCHICIFCPPLFLCGESYKYFRNNFFENFNFNKGIIFQASHFCDVANSWGISFSIWNCGVQQNKNNFIYNCVDNINGEVQIIQNKIIYNVDDKKTASMWVREKSNNVKTIDYPNFTSALNIKNEQGSRKGMIEPNSIGYMHCSGNNVGASGINTGLYTGVYAGGIGVSINTNNFNRIFDFYYVRKNIICTWINCKDEYIEPNEQHPKFNEFENDALVYGLFDSNLSSLRQIKYHDKLWDIKNEFFWMSKSEIESLANEYNNDECYNDAHTSPERFVYQKLQEIELSPEAQAVLDKASDIVRNTFPFRKLFNDSQPEYQINNWDCGWYQIKVLAKEYAKDDLEEFKKLYKALANKMRPIVYELGFLK